MSERSSQQRVLRAAATTVVGLASILVLLPLLLGWLNTMLGWPQWRHPGLRATGVGSIVVGSAIIAHCTWTFARIGRGSTIPTDPPRLLVIRGLYHYSRNPIYVGDAAVILGIAFLNGGLAPLLYVGLYVVAMEALIVLREEPGLKKRFGSDYERYCSEVPRWLL